MKGLKNKIIALLLLSFVVSGCANTTNETAGFKTGDDIKLLDNIKMDYDNAIFDDFANGVNKSNWYIGNQAWGGGNGGVIPANVNYTDDGVLVFTANGKYYSDNDVRGVGDVKDGRYTGAAIISKFKVRSGRFEVKMKVLPRQGACTAFWVYANDTQTGANHEIDIELPGGNIERPVTFENVLNTNYITEEFRQSQDTKMSSLYEDGKEVYLNDGEWHVFGFDWYTNPELVVYYVDGKVTAVSDIFVPFMESRLWLGCWFPVTSSFVGTAEFEKDNMYVDYVKYIPFLNQPYEEFDPPISGYALENEYPTSPIPVPNINKISNGTFENIASLNIGSALANEVEVYGWHLTKKLSEDKNLEEVVEIIDGVGFDNSKALILKDGAVVYQTIDSVYHNFKYDFSFHAKGKGRAIVAFYGKTTSETLDTITINIDEEDLTLFTKELIAPQNCQSIMINFDTSDGNSLLIDNLSLLNK
ncbi:MAG: glycoside hydrolase family 16 protein [Erysipelotrichales bacterium]|nr:glycoside hydrolase family 16 protein [Erysipelotrichales bacterium]